MQIDNKDKKGVREIKVEQERERDGEREGERVGERERERKIKEKYNYTCIKKQK